jgi:hypothetical protein
MLPDGVSAATTVEGPFVCIRTPEALAHVGSLVTVSGYAAGADEVHVEIRGVDARQDQEVVLASLQVQVESSTVTSADGAVLGTWSAQLPLLPPAGVERRARIVAELGGDGTGSAASSEIAVDLDTTR